MFINNTILSYTVIKQSIICASTPVEVLGLGLGLALTLTLLPSVPIAAFQQYTLPPDIQTDLES
jgi:hypothetical protein